jgi:hypothetical protein
MIRISALESLELWRESQRRARRAAERVLSIAESRTQPGGDVEQIKRLKG